MPLSTKLITVCTCVASCTSFGMARYLAREQYLSAQVDCSACRFTPGARRQASPIGGNWIRHSATQVGSVLINQIG